MGIKSLALTGAAVAALGAGVALPAMAAEQTHGGCHLTCKNLPIMQHGKNYGYVHVWVHGKKISGVVHVKKTMKPGVYTFKGHCKPHTHPVVHHTVIHHTTHVTHITHVTHTTQTRSVPSSAPATGFGGASELNLPLTGGALAMIAGGLGVGVLARRRVTGALS